VVAQLAVVAMAVLRWTGQAPYGSDNDEYRMLAEALYTTGQPLVAGVEGSKYPLGWSLLLGAFEQLGLDITATAFVLNVAFLAGTVAVVWLIARRYGPLAAAAGALAVAVGASLWSSVYVVMPDAALTFVTAAAFWAVLHLDDDRRPMRWHVGWLTALAAAAVLLKTVGLVLAGALTVALFLRPWLRRWSWLPVTVGLALTAAQAALIAPYPEHTTGYAATFWLRDPYDAAGGSITAAQLPGRIVERLDLFLTDAGFAVLGAHVPSPVGITVTLVLLAVTVVAYRRLRWSALAFMTVYAVLLAAWPFRSSRFGLPLVPLAAIGFAALIGAARRRAGGPVVASVLAVALLVPHVVGNVRAVHADAAAEETQLAALAAASDDLTDWIAANVPADEPIASLDYRELAYRTGREVLPLGYTTDTEALLAASAGRGARWLVVVRGLYGRREARADALLSAHPDRFALAYRNARTDVYRILPEGTTP
jgi:hypothetical protein